MGVVIWLSMVKSLQNSILMFALLAMAGCAKPSGFHADGVPKEMARVEDLDLTPEDQELLEIDVSKLEEYKGEDLDETYVNAHPVAQRDSEEVDTLAPKGSTSAPHTAPPARSAVAQRATSVSRAVGGSTKTSSAVASSWKAVGAIATWVIQYEGDRVGRACNRFVQRVFEHMGFGKGSWLANEFDSYAARTFGSYKLKTFSHASPEKDGEALKEYLWSHPERTAFVFQWKRPGPHGHIGFVQRIKNDLVIYHASLNQFKPKEKSVTIETLLYKGGPKNQLLVYSHFQKKK